MKRFLIFLLLVIILLSGCSMPSLHISGDSQSVGAEIYIDGQKVGVMEKRVYSGPKPSEKEIKEQRESQQRLGIKPTNPLKPGDVFSSAAIDVSSGKHEIIFISKEGKRLKKDIVIQGENYMGVNFEDMTIQGGD